MNNVKLGAKTDSTVLVINLIQPDKKELENNSFFEIYLPIILALIATVVSFITLYLTKLKKGKLTIGLPNKFFIKTTNHHPSFNITIALVNAGVIPISVNNIYLIAKRNKQILFKINVAEFTFDSVVVKEDSPEIVPNKIRQVTNPIILNSGEKEILSLSFNEYHLLYTFEEGIYEFTLEFLLNNRISQRKKISFKIKLRNDTIEDFYSKDSIKNQIEKDRYVGIYTVINNSKSELIFPSAKGKKLQSRTKCKMFMWAMRLTPFARDVRKH